MSQIRTVRDRIAPLLRSRERLLGQFVPQSSITPLDWMSYARIFSRSALALADPSKTHALPRVQLYGIALECALKAFLLFSGAPVPTGAKGHDLIALGESAEAQGLAISELQAIALVQAASLYFADLATGNKYRARYPWNRGEHPRDTVGYFPAIDELVESIGTQCGV